MHGLGVAMGHRQERTRRHQGRTPPPGAYPPQDALSTMTMRDGLPVRHNGDRPEGSSGTQALSTMTMRDGLPVGTMVAAPRAAAAELKVRGVAMVTVDTVVDMSDGGHHGHGHGHHGKFKHGKHGHGMFGGKFKKWK